MKQCDEYYKCLEEGDYFGANYLYIPPIPKNIIGSQSLANIESLKANLDYELERINNMDPELLELEIRFTK